MEIDIHNGGKRLEGALRRLNSSKISVRNKEIIADHINELTAKFNLSQVRQAKLYDELRKTAIKIEVNFDRVNKKDLMRLLKWINDNGFSPDTAMDYRSHIKRILKYLGKKDLAETIQNPRKEYNRNRLNSKMIMTPEEIMSMIEAERSLRWRAFMWLLWESGARIGEMLSLKVKDIEKTPDGIFLHIRSGKTGARESPLPMDLCGDVIITYIKSGRGNPEDPLFNMPYTTCQKHLQEMGKRVGITEKNTGSKWWRKARATELSKTLDAHSLMVWMGWIKIDTALAYIRRSGKDMINRYRRINLVHKKLIKQEKQEENRLRNIIQQELKTLLKIDQSKVRPILKALDHDNQEQFDELVKI